MSSLLARSTLSSFGLGLALLYALTLTLPARAQEPSVFTPLKPPSLCVQR